MKVEILNQKGHKFLWIDDSLWMWDLQVENKIQQSMAKQSYGNVLIAGYGLGLVQQHLLKNKKVKSVTTIELVKKVIDLNKKSNGKIFGSYIIGDFYKFSSKSKYDCIIGDIWADIVPSELNYYKRFKKKALKLLKPNGKILAWGKDYFEYLIEKGL